MQIESVQNTVSTICMSLFEFFLKINMIVLPRPSQTKILEYAPSISFTILQVIWNHRNQVVHEGKHPNPKEVILATQSLICKYQEAFNKEHTSNRVMDYQPPKYKTRGNQQLIIKVAGIRRKKPSRSTLTYEAKNL